MRQITRALARNSGLNATGGSDLPASVIPFLLRGVKLLGIDSVLCPAEERKAIWARLATDLPLDKLDAITQTVKLEVLPEWGAKILKGEVRGRVVVEMDG